MEQNHISSRKSVVTHISSDSDFEVGSGLGGSGAYHVALKLAFNNLHRNSLSLLEIAEGALSLERLTTQSVCGIQDHTAASFGGLIRIRINRKGELTVIQEIELYEHFSKYIAPNLFLVGTGKFRESNKSLVRAQQPNSIRHYQKSLLEVEQYEEAIKSKNPIVYGELLEAHTLRKIKLGLVPEQAVEIMKVAKSVGAYGSKLIGAGNGGYCLISIDGNKFEELQQYFQNSVIRVTVGNVGVQRDDSL